MTNSAPRVVTVGDVVTDVSVRMLGERMTGSDSRASISNSPGGSGANTAAWLARLGIESHFIARVGDDVFGRHQIEELRRAGVTPHVAVDQARPTGAIVLLIDAMGERDMLTDRGANAGLHPGDLPDRVLEGATHLHLSGYALFEPGPRSAAEEALSRARSAGLTTSVDPSSTSGLAEVGVDSWLEWTRGIDLCFPNFDEARLLGGAGSQEANARRLTSVYGEVVVKLGRAGALWAGAAGDTLTEPAINTDVLDTTGAGDAFSAGFLAGWVRGAPPTANLRAAVAVSAGAVNQLGGRPHP